MTYNASIFIALAGNPNTGKSTIFNALTGSRQHVGNYPGVTVERKEGKTTHAGFTINVLDLPGTYGLGAYSPDETVARNALINEKIDVVINVVDATNLERNLGLTAQLKEMGIPMVLALNMHDMAQGKGLQIDTMQMGKLIGCPVIPVVGSRQQGLEQLLESAVAVYCREKGIQREQPGCPGKCHGCPANAPLPAERLIRYNDDLENTINHLAAILPDEVASGELRPEIMRRWTAIKLLEGDKLISARVAGGTDPGNVLSDAEDSRTFLSQHLGEDPQMLIAAARFGFARGIIRETVQSSTQDELDATARIDRIFLNRLLGLPLFFVIMWALFQITFTVGAYPVAWLEIMFSHLAAAADQISSPLLRSIIVDAAIGGVGGVLTFMPNILLLFLGISFLEGSGYMARAAFVTDRLMHRIGLHGKSFIPMLIGFGCSVPGIMATRTLENDRDRITTIMAVPFISCGARLPVYVLLSSAFFSGGAAANAMFAVYIIGVLVAIATAKLLRVSILRGEPEPFVMELPPYRMPTINSIFIHMWERGWMYLQKAGTIILAASVIVWFLFAMPVKEGESFPVDNPDHSVAGMLGEQLQPIFAPLGFDDKITVALIAGVAAKEVVVSTLTTLYSMEGDSSDASISLEQKVKNHSGLNAASAFALMIFVALYIPCLATLAVIRKETNSWGWALLSGGYSLAIAWVFALIAYRIGMILIT